MTSRRRWMLLALAGLTMALAGAAAQFFFLLNAPVQVRRPVDFEVHRGESPTRVAQRLADAGVVRSAPVMLFLARTRGLDRDIRFGIHRFEGALTPSQVLEELIQPPRPTIRVTFPEGSTWADNAKELERIGAASAAAYREAVCDPALLAELRARPGANCAEGYLFPDTYNLAPGMSAADIVRVQVKRFDAVMTSLLDAVPPGSAVGVVVRGRPAPGEAWRTDARARAHLIGDVVTLASIVEREARLAEERGLVASVFHNRLRRGLRLQADPTIIYGLHAAGTPWDGTLLHKHLRQPGPYNTYTSDGLTPGPICNPGRDALRAALVPPTTDFLYFVARGDGSHEFTATLADHNRAVARLRVHAARRDAAARSAAQRGGDRDDGGRAGSTSSTTSTGSSGSSGSSDSSRSPTNGPAAPGARDSAPPSPGPARTGGGAGG